MSIVIFFIIGFAGALAKDILADNCLKLPTFQDHNINLGFLGSAILGGFVAIAVDHSYLTAFFSGYVGWSVIEGLIPKKLNGFNNS